MPQSQVQYTRLPDSPQTQQAPIPFTRRSPLYRYVLTALVATAVSLFILSHTEWSFPTRPFAGLFGPSSSQKTPSTNLSTMQGKRHVGYFVNWGIYGRKFPPQMIPAAHLTHLNYAFANVNKDTGEVALSDKWADVEIHYDGDSWNEPGTNLYGCLKAIYLLKKQNRHLKVLLSIGGWSYSPNFVNIANPAWRTKFVQSAVKLVEDVGLDGLDIDYEYPKTASDAEAYVHLLGELRAGLEGLAQSKGAPQGQYQLSVAAPCGTEQMNVLRIAEMDRFLDFWNLMAYDFAGSWDSVAGHQANLYSADGNGQSVDRAVRHYLGAGVHPYKLTIGLPLYGRAFCGTQGPGAPYKGIGKGSWEDGMWDYKALPQPGAEVINDHALGASYSMDRSTGTMISYDTQPIVIQKAQYIHQMGLGGAMWWELDADAPEDTGKALVRTMREQLGQLDQRPNDLNYPGSMYENLRKGMN